MITKWLDKPCNDPACSGRYKHTKEFNEWWAVCDECENFLFLYDPMPHQLRFHRDTAKFKMYGGKLICRL